MPERSFSTPILTSTGHAAEAIRSPAAEASEHC